MAFRGKEVKLWCIYGGTPLPEIRWRKQGGALPWGRTTFDNYGKTLVIKHVDFADAGDYTCEASNGVGLAKSHSIDLKVRPVPIEKFGTFHSSLGVSCFHLMCYIISYQHLKQAERPQKILEGLTVVMMM